MSLRKHNTPRRSPRRKSPVTAACTAAGLLFAGAAQAEPQTDLATRFRINDDNPRASMPSQADRNRDPLEFGYWLQDMIGRGEAAAERGDWQGVIKYYAVLRDAVPQQVTSYRRLCKAHRTLQQPTRALEPCRAALGLDGAVVQDHLVYLDLVLAGGSLSPDAAEGAKASLAHLREHARLHPQALPGQTSEPVVRADDMTREQRKADPKKWLRLKAQEAIERSAGKPAEVTSGQAMHLPTQIEIFSCRLGVLTGDAARLAECTGKLRSYDFPQALIVPFAWAQALAEKDEKKANEVLKLAERQGLPESALSMMREEQARHFTAQAQSGATAGLALPLGLAFLLGLLALVAVRRAKSSTAS